MVPAFQEVILTLDELTQVALGHVLIAIRMAFIGVIVVRSYRNRLGLNFRTEAVPTIIFAAALAGFIQIALGVANNLAVGLSPVSWPMGVTFLEWVGFALLGTLFVFPGAAENIPLRYRAPAQRERGAVSAFLVPAIAGLIAVTILAITVIGSATNDRRESTTAADAAALAAAQEWRKSLEHVFDHHSSGGNPDQFWNLIDQSIGSGTSNSLAAANSYAQKNGAEVYDFRIDHNRAEITVWVRNKDTVPHSTKKITSVATARLEFKSGLCRSGNKLGYLMDGVCHSQAPTPDPTPEPAVNPEDPDEESPDPTPTPFEAPNGLGPFKVDVFLTTTP